MTIAIHLYDRDFSNRARVNQATLSANLKAHYDFIICGAGSSGSVIARRLAENPLVNVLLIEAGSSDDVASVMAPGLWPTNLGSERDWGFQADPNPHVNGRSMPMNMGKVLGGGSSINVMVWARGHRSDWDFFASEAGDEAWGYDAVLDIYRRIEDWRGSPDHAYRGTGGPVFVQPSPDPSPIALAMLDAARRMDIPVFDSQNGRMMEGDGGCALTDVLIRDGKRQSIFRAYTYPYLDRPNLTVLTETLVSRLVLDATRVTGVEIIRGGERLVIGAGTEVVLSLGAIQTPKVLMHSGIGDEAELRRLSIPVVQHLPGVGQNLHDHVSFGCIWDYKNPIPPRNNGAEATLYWKSSAELTGPDLLFCQAEFPVPSPETAVRGVPLHGWTMFAGLAQPKSRGRVYLTSSDLRHSARIDANTLAHPDDMSTALTCVELCRDLGNSAAFEPLVRAEIMPGASTKAARQQFIRDAAVTYWHQTSTAKMGRDAMSVVDRTLKVYGIDNLRIGDGSIMPRVTTGNTMAPCVIIGERAAQMLRNDHRI
ncbi:MAG TPA: GMC family oxidoreductase N-terminal domain-containing protein [Aliidongia sp.]|nr:GMC family oxidoreductase N-terminal domain-containing protein [Aliidongia sp.]